MKRNLSENILFDKLKLLYQNTLYLYQNRFKGLALAIVNRFLHKLASRGDGKSPNWNATLE